jgi:hypothetical protein
MNNNLNDNIIIDIDNTNINNNTIEIYNNLLIVKIYKLLKSIFYIIFKLSCIFIIIQGLGIILLGDFASIIIGFYVILFTILLFISKILRYKDLIKKSLPIINSHIFRSLIILLLGNISRKTNYNINWNKFIQYLCICLFVFYIILHLYKKYLIKIKNEIKLSLTYVIYI